MPNFDRYQLPAFDEPALMPEPEDESVTTCNDCERFFRCTARDARVVLNAVNPYSHLARSSYGKKAVGDAVKRCGICAVEMALKWAGELSCSEHFEPEEQ